MSSDPRSALQTADTELILVDTELKLNGFVPAPSKWWLLALALRHNV